MEKINIAELLKDCPKGMELDCPMFENLEFNRVEEDNGTYYIIGQVKTEIGYNVHTFTKHGCYTSNKYAKCVIFPKGKTTWEGFVPPCKFKDGDIVYVQSKTFHGRYYEYICIYKENTVDNYNLHKYIAICGDDFLYNTTALCYKSVITNIRLATEEEKQKLFQAIKDNGYKWIPETKTLEELPKFKVGDKVKHIDDKTVIIITGIKDGYYFIQFYNTRRKDYQNEKVSFKDQDEYELVPNKFDITKLKPFKSEVLIRNDKTQKWIPAFWGCKADNRNYVTTYGTCRYCIPYEGNEHLLTTNNDCSDYYKTWEE